MLKEKEFCMRFQQPFWIRKQWSFCRRVQWFELSTWRERILICSYVLVGIQKGLREASARGVLVQVFLEWRRGMLHYFVFIWWEDVVEMGWTYLVPSTYWQIPNTLNLQPPLSKMAWGVIVNMIPCTQLKRKLIVRLAKGKGVMSDLLLLRIPWSVFRTIFTY